MHYLRQLALRFVVKVFLTDFEVIDRKLSDGEYDEAMNELSENGALNRYFNIMIGNLIRRHLYVKDMLEGNWYLGQIAALRKIQTDSQRWKAKRIEGRQPTIEEKT